MTRWFAGILVDALIISALIFLGLYTIGYQVMMAGLVPLLAYIAVQTVLLMRDPRRDRFTGIVLVAVGVGGSALCVWQALRPGPIS